MKDWPTLPFEPELPFGTTLNRMEQHDLAGIMADPLDDAQCLLCRRIRELTAANKELSYQLAALNELNDLLG